MSLGTNPLGSQPTEPSSTHRPSQEQPLGETDERTRSVSRDEFTNRENPLESPSLKERVTQKENLEEPSKSQIIELTVSLFEESIKKPETFNKEAELSKLPEFAKQFYNVLEGLQDKSMNMIEAYDLIKHEDWPLYAAHIINVQKIPLMEVMAGWKNLDLLSLTPHLRYVNMSGLDTRAINKMLSFLTNVDTLIISSSEIKELPPLPNCQILDLKDCYHLTNLPELPKCQIIKLTGTKLTTLPELPNCQDFSCFECNALTALPELLECQKFNYMGKLTTLPSLPNCQTFRCDNCPITDLPALPNCQDFTCYNCRALTAFPVMPSCQKLMCSFCRALINLPELQNCQELVCTNCAALASLPELPVCRTINCSDCLSLNLFPNALPACTRLICPRCPIADRLPELPANARVSSGLSDIFPKLMIDVDDLEKNPRKYLDALGNYLLKGKSFPNVYYQKDGELSEGIDVGGLRRDFVTRICRSIFAEKPDEGHLKVANMDTKEGLEPIARDSDEVDYRTLGQLIARCYLEESFFTTGTIFRTSFFQSLLDYKNSTSDDDLAKIFVNFEVGEAISDEMKNIRASISKDLDPEKSPQAALTACMFIDKYDEGFMEAKFGEDWESAKVTHEQYKEIIWPKFIEVAKNHGYIKAISWIADEIKKKLGEEDWNELGEMKAVALQEKIQGRLTANLLKEKMAYHKGSDLIPNADLIKIKTYFETWIDENKENTDLLALFVEGVTSNSTLCAKGIKIEVYNRDPQYVPTAHTCFFSLEVSSNYKDQEAFNRAIQLFLDNYKVGTGFQAA